MGDAKAAVAAAAALALNGQATAMKTTSASAPPTPHHGPAAPVPQLSPTPGHRPGRRLHTKVLDELKHVASRKSPAINPNAAPTGHAAPLPSPLNLHALSSSDAVSESSGVADAAAIDTDSPRVPAHANGHNGKSKTCSICDRSFTVFRPKHTCKVCGKKICDDCSKNRVKLNRRLERRKGSRLCDTCARDHIQTSTPLLSPTERHVMEEADDTDDSGRGREAVVDTGGRPASKANVTQEMAMQERLQRGHSSLRKTFVMSSELDLYEDGDSYLRSRHWISIVSLACVLFARLLRVQAVSVHDGVITEARGVTALLFSLTNWVDYLASLRVIGSYLLGLVVYDEFTARSQRGRLRKTSSPASTTHPMSALRRSRTRSGVSESGRSGVGRTHSNTPKSVPAVVHERDEDEVLEVEVGDKHADDSLGFSFDKMQTTLTDCTTKNRSADGEMKMSCFLAACDNVCGFILVFGRATAFAASTVTGYMSTITTNLAAWPVPASAANSATFSWKEQSIRAVVAREVELNLAATGGKKKPSCSRCVLRLLWFIEFVEACMRYTLIENTDEHCAAGASKAYEETIGSRHPWIIRKGVNSALASLPTRSGIIKSLHLHELSPEETLVHLKKVQGSMRNIIDDITALLKEHKLMDIK